ncbi:hypothetical protein L195_g047025 [Trifolium pratense]|uniref:RNase H type-1 domain-containing protein n=1 Tax=Trifolium pratense TaxID=57577 RepID=A0A2K3MJC4_TRIPR|nr:hypothetical protein L195_g047025 [Trifolium pratense]
MDRDTAGLFAVLLWVLWNNRNDKVWNGSTEAGRSLGSKLGSSGVNDTRCRLNGNKGQAQQQQQVLTWQKPPTGWYKCNADAGEALAVLEAMKEVKDRGITHAIFETDSKNVVEFTTYVVFIKRQANMVAHILARAAISWSSRYICETLPFCITPLLNNEMI